MGTVRTKNTFLHHDAKYEMRSKPTSGGHGHQAMYNIGGQLITAPIAAGTADLYAPFDSLGIPSSAKSHRDQDVYPFIRALQLDGNRCCHGHQPQSQPPHLRGPTRQMSKTPCSAMGNTDMKTSRFSAGMLCAPLRRPEQRRLLRRTQARSVSRLLTPIFPNQLSRRSRLICGCV